MATPQVLVLKDIAMNYSITTVRTLFCVIIIKQTKSIFIKSILQKGSILLEKGCSKSVGSIHGCHRSSLARMNIVDNIECFCSTNLCNDNFFDGPILHNYNNGVQIPTCRQPIIILFSTINAILSAFN
jgi:hypothetical protein